MERKEGEGAEAQGKRCEPSSGWHTWLIWLVVTTGTEKESNKARAGAPVSSLSVSMTTPALVPRVSWFVRSFVRSPKTPVSSPFTGHVVVVVV